MPSLSALAGTFTGTAVVVSSSAAQAPNTVITVSASGALSSSSNGCSMTGTVSPRRDSDAFNVSMSFAATGCVSTVAGQTLAGLGSFSSVSKSFTILASNTARTGAVFYLANKRTLPFN